MEAIYILATGKSQKALYDKDLINYSRDHCAIEGLVESQNENYLLNLQIVAKSPDSNITLKKASTNKVPKTLSGFAGTLTACIFSPEDINIVTGPPSDRRRYLDLLLSQTDHNYKKTLNLYLRAVRQRNKVLEMIREEHRGAQQLDFWNSQITAQSQILHESRQNFVEFAKKIIPNYSERLIDGEKHIEFAYKKSEITLERLSNYKEKEIASKQTLIGPHRDDFLINVGQKNMAEFGSRGQQRAVVLLLKLLEIAYLEEIKKERPVLLLDDIFSELDSKHRKYVLDIINQQQTIATSAESSEILGVKRGKIINL